MSIFSSLKKSWDDKAADAAALKLAQAAVASSKPEDLQVVLKDLPDRARFFEKNAAGLLSQAIDRKDARTFLTLLQYTENPNFVLSFTYRNTRDVTVTEYYPLLNRALKEGAHDIALALAQNSRVALENKHSGRGEVLNLARHAGMSDVLQILLRRTATLRRQEADALDREADEISKPLVASSPKI